jgi:hypothetical protein
MLLLQLLLSADELPNASTFKGTHALTVAAADDVATMS